MDDTFDPDGPANAGGIFGLPDPPEEARVVLLPVPWEATVSYGGGTSDGPAAILHASRQVDLLCPLFGHPWRAGIALLPEPEGVRAAEEEAFARARRIVAVDHFLQQRGEGYRWGVRPGRGGQRRQAAQDGEDADR